MSISGISHLTFVVHDLDRTARLLVEGLGAREVYDSGDRPHSLSRETFFELGGAWIAVMEGEPLPQRSYRHVAFAVEASDLPIYRARLDVLGVDIRPPRPRIEGEGESLYFHDFVTICSNCMPGRWARDCRHIASPSPKSSLCAPASHCREGVRRHASQWLANMSPDPKGRGA